MVCTVDRLAVLKILLHSAKYPSSAVNGVLLGHSSTEGSSRTIGAHDQDKSLHITDVIPLFHSFLTLAPSLETALFQVNIPAVVPELPGCSHLCEGCVQTVSQFIMSVCLSLLQISLFRAGRRILHEAANVEGDRILPCK
jgi:hypothetical protein